MKRLNPQAKRTDTKSDPPPNMKQRWKDLWEQIPPVPTTKDDDAWEQAAETSGREDPKDVVDGQEFQGPGQ